MRPKIYFISGVSGVGKSSAMKHLASIHQKDVFPQMKEELGVAFEDRLTGRAIVMDGEGNLGLVGNNKNDVLQLPGGGIDDSENIQNGIVRECREEIGCIVEIKNEVGVIDDFRTRDKKHCINYCYVVQVIGKKGNPEFTQGETDIGMYTKWVHLETALELFRKQRKELDEGKISFYNTGFNILRDLTFLEQAIASDLLHE